MVLARGGKPFSDWIPNSALPKDPAPAGLGCPVLYFYPAGMQSHETGSPNFAREGSWGCSCKFLIV